MDALRGREFDAVFDVARIPAHVGPVLDALADGAGHWSFISSISAYAEHATVTDELYEPAPDDSTDPSVEVYGASKVAIENMVRDRLGDRALVTRPGLIVGAGDPVDRLGYWPLRFSEGGEILAPGRGSARSSGSTSRTTRPGSWTPPTRGSPARSTPSATTSAWRRSSTASPTPSSSRASSRSAPTSRGSRRSSSSNRR
nr:hypothetical protein GCM10025732_19430 [Glycomyces mayteni]